MDNEKNPVGRPAHEPTPETRKMVQAMSGYGVQHYVIAEGIGISENTLRLHYKEDLEKGRAKAHAQIGKRLFDKATQDGDTTALIWYTKAQMGWRDQTKIVTDDGDGGDAPIGLTPELIVASVKELMKK